MRRNFFGCHNLSVGYVGENARQFYYADAAQGGSSGCSLYALLLGQTFTSGPEGGYLKFAAAKPRLRHAASAQPHLLAEDRAHGRAGRLRSLWSSRRGR